MKANLAKMSRTICGYEAQGPLSRSAGRWHSANKKEGCNDRDERKTMRHWVLGRGQNRARSGNINKHWVIAQ